MNLTKYKKQCKKNKKKKAIKTMQQYSHDSETSIEKAIRIYLQDSGIFFVQEYPIKMTFRKIERYKVYDFYVSGMTRNGNQFQFLAECDGFYFHSHKYLEGNQAYSKLNGMQKKNLKNDKLKNEMAKHLGLPLLRLKEKDIKYRFKDVKKEIWDMINSFDS